VLYAVYSMAACTAGTGGVYLRVCMCGGGSRVAARIVVNREGLQPREGPQGFIQDVRVMVANCV
jgi:hypothetical protein